MHHVYVFNGSTEMVNIQYQCSLEKNRWEITKMGSHNHGNKSENIKTTKNDVYLFFSRTQMHCHHAACAFVI